MDRQGPALTELVASPFGGDAHLRQTMSTDSLIKSYKQKCDVDVTWCFGGLPEIGLYECTKTGYKFWRPESVAGDEAFYHLLSHAWPNYYREERWESSLARKFLEGKKSLLEIGCGRGFFLRSVKGIVDDAVGIEFNQDAIRNKVTTFPILSSKIEDFARTRPASFDVVCSFQVLEHVTNPRTFIESALASLADGGLLLLSTPDYDSPTFNQQGDPFDLPPHHVGHFNTAIYGMIAAEFGLEVMEIMRESEVAASSAGTGPNPDRTPAHLASKAAFVAKMAFKHPLSTATLLTQKPGTKILAVFRKPAG